MAGPRAWWWTELHPAGSWSLVVFPRTCVGSALFNILINGLDEGIECPLSQFEGNIHWVGILICLREGSAEGFGLVWSMGWGQLYEVQQNQGPGTALGSPWPQAVLQVGGRVAGKLSSEKGPEVVLNLHSLKVNEIKSKVLLWDIFFA